MKSSVPILRAGGRSRAVTLSVCVQDTCSSFPGSHVLSCLITNLDVGSRIPNVKEMLDFLTLPPANAENLVPYILSLGIMHKDQVQYSYNKWGSISYKEAFHLHIGSDWLDCI